MGNTICIKGTETGITSSSKLSFKELGFDFKNGDLYIGDKDGNPLIVAKSEAISKLTVKNGNLVIDGNIIATNISVDVATLGRIVVGEEYRGSEDPNNLSELETDDGTLYFKIV